MNSQNLAFILQVIMIIITEVINRRLIRYVAKRLFFLQNIPSKNPFIFYNFLQAADNCLAFYVSRSYTAVQS